MLNPHALAGPVRAVWSAAARAAHGRLAAVGSLETRGDGADIDRIAAWVRDTRPDVVVAGGGDGTVSDVVAALMRQVPESRPGLGILPLGTANNVARSLGLTSIRTGGRAALTCTLDAIAAGPARSLDVARVNERHFVGSLAIGMDADILVLRNRLRQRFRLGRRLGGYPLYLGSCALNLLTRGHGTHARLRVDGVETNGHVYNLLVTNTALYAGEFTFDAGDRSDDGLLDLLAFAHGGEYVARFVRAWRRHVASTAGRPVTPDVLRRVHALDIELARPLPVQLDGEEYGPTARLAIRVLPEALRVCVPAAAIRQREHDGLAAGERVSA